MERAIRDRFDRELPEIHARVLATAVLLVRRTRWRRAKGETVAQLAKDLLQEAVFRTLRPGKTRNWDPRQVGLEPFLVMTMRSILDTHERSPATHGVPLLAEIPRNGNPGPEDGSITAEACEQIVETALEAASGSHELETIVCAMIDGCEKSQEIADATGIPVERVYVAVRTLRRRLRRARESG